MYYFWNGSMLAVNVLNLSTLEVRILLSFKDDFEQHLIIFSTMTCCFIVKFCVFKSGA